MPAPWMLLSQMTIPAVQHGPGIGGDVADVTGAYLAGVMQCPRAGKIRGTWFRIAAVSEQGNVLVTFEGVDADGLPDGVPLGSVLVPVVAENETHYARLTPAEYFAVTRGQRIAIKVAPTGITECEVAVVTGVDSAFPYVVFDGTKSATPPLMTLDYDSGNTASYSETKDIGGVVPAVVADTEETEGVGNDYVLGPNHEVVGVWFRALVAAGEAMDFASGVVGDPSGAAYLDYAKTNLSEFDETKRPFCFFTRPSVVKIGNQSDADQDLISARLTPATGSAMTDLTLAGLDGIARDTARDTLAWGGQVKGVVSDSGFTGSFGKAFDMGLVVRSIRDVTAAESVEIATAVAVNGGEFALPEGQGEFSGFAPAVFMAEFEAAMRLSEFMGDDE